MTKAMKLETLEDLYLRYLIEKGNIESGSKTEYNPLTGRMSESIPNLEAYKYADGKLNGFLLANEWYIDRLGSTVFVRRHSDCRIVGKFEIEKYDYE